MEAALRKSRAAFGKWRRAKISDRLEKLKRASEYIKSNKESLAGLATLEMGKPIRDSIKEMEKCTWVLEYFADNAEIFLEDERVETGSKKSYIAFEPIGTILAVTPWNLPFWQVIRFAAPTLAVGNTIVLKHSSSVPMCALGIEKIFRLSGFPSGVFQTVLTDAEGTESLIKNDVIKAVTFTGSVEIGQKIAEMSGAVGKKVVLELGGSDPFIVLEDADIDKACEVAAKARLLNCGQTCNSPKRFVVVEDVAGEFTRGLKKNFESAVVGDPMDIRTDVGPLSNENQLKKLESQVRDAVQKGADVITGGYRLGGPGFFYAPTLLSDIKKNMRVVNEEVFGPVSPIIVAKDEKDAIKIANDTEFGLGGSVWTRDLRRGERIARQIDAGFVTINKQVTSDPRLPFGGVKKSGFGRELSRYGMLEFVNMKAVTVA